MFAGGKEWENGKEETSLSLYLSLSSSSQPESIYYYCGDMNDGGEEKERRRRKRVKTKKGIVGTHDNSRKVVQ